MNKKKLVSLGIAATFTAIGVTGLLLYLVQHNKPTKVIHTTFGVLFVFVALFHILNNWSSLTSYIRGTVFSKVNKEFLMVVAVTVVLVAGTGFLLPPFTIIEEIGEHLREGERKRTERISFSRIETNQGEQGKAIILQLQKTDAVLLPAIAVWAEDSAGNFIDNIFVPAKMLAVYEDEAGNEAHAIEEGEVEEMDLSPEALKTWRFRSIDPDANWPEATPNENLVIQSVTKAKGPFQVYVEITDIGKSELYVASVSGGGSVAALKPVEGGLMLSGFVQFP